MMNSDTWIQHYENAPSAVRFYLLDPLSKEGEIAARKQLAYEHDVWDRVMDVVWETVFEQLSLQDFREKIRRLAGDRKPEDVERAVLLAVVLPLADLVTWDVEGRLQELGMSVPDIQSVPRVSLRPVSYGAAVRRMASMAKLSVLQEEMFRRLREAFVSFAKGVRTIEQFKELLLRNQADGGVGLSREQVDRYVQVMMEFMSTTQVLSEKDYADWLTRFQQENETAEASRGPSPTSPPTEESELAALAARTPAVSSGPLDAAIDDTVAKVALPNLDEFLVKRLRSVISTRLRDVRNPSELVSMLTRDAHVGGLGLTPEEANRVAGIVEQAYQLYREPLEAHEKGQIEEAITIQKTKIAERKQRESEEHAAWFQEKMQGRPEALLRQQMMGGGEPMVPAPGGAQKGVQAQVSASSAALGVGAGRPSLDNVRAPTRLFGLAEELAGFTVQEFRRSAKDPEQAAKKVKQKLDALQQQSFEQWTQGVEAWRQSPLQQQYLKLVADSFSSGIPVAELADDRHKEDPNVPTSAEVGAIVGLNSQIQY